MVQLVGYAETDIDSSETFTEPIEKEQTSSQPSRSSDTPALTLEQCDQAVCADAIDADRSLASIATQPEMKNLIFLWRLSPDPDDRKTLAEIGLIFGVTRERIRQIEVRVTRLLLRGRRENAATLDPIYDGFNRAFDLAITLEGADGRLPLGFQRGSFLSKLFLYLGGEYELRLGHIFRNSFDSFVEVAKARVRKRLEDGSLSQDQYISTVEELGVSSALAETVVNQLPRIVDFNGRLLELSGSQRERAYALLTAVGEPLTAEEIAKTLRAPLGSIRNAILGDASFIRVDKQRFGLKEWGAEEYTTIVDKIRQYIKMQGGHAYIKDIVKDLTSRFGVSENSVKMYCTSSFFSDPTTGIVSIKKKKQDSPKRREPLLTRGIFLEGQTVVLRWRVHGRFGSGNPIPIAAAQVIGLKRGQTTTRSISGYLIAFSWTSAYPSLWARDLC